MCALTYVQLLELTLVMKQIHENFHRTMLKQHSRPNCASLLNTVHIPVSDYYLAIYSLRLKKLKSIKLTRDWKYFLVWNNSCLGWRGVYKGIPQHSHLKLYYSFLLEGLRFHCEIGENFRKTAHFWLGFPPPCEVALCICTKQVRIYPSFCYGAVNQNFRLCKGG